MLFAKDIAAEASSTLLARGGLKVMVADDHHLVREGLKLCLKALQSDVQVIEAETLEAAIQAFHAQPDIDLVLLDLNMPGTQGGETLEQFMSACPIARTVVVSATYDLRTVQTALGMGILGFIPKLSGRNSFVSALRFVLGGGVYIPPEVLMPAAAVSPEPAVAPPPAARPASIAAQPAQVAQPATSIPGLRGARLTARQLDVLAQLIDGKPNKQICRELNLALGTVKCHVGAILGALEVSSRAEAIAAADKRGWREWLSRPRMENQLHA